MGQTLHEINRARGLRVLVLLFAGLGVIAPILLGLWQTLRAGFGVLPALGHHTPSLAPWRALAEQPGITTSLRLSVTTGFAATILSLALAAALCAMLHARLSQAANARLLAPFLSIPHAAMAVGLAFMLAPSGWIARVIAPLAGWDRPPGLASVNDGLGLALTFGLMVKEIPFLVLVMQSALGQIPLRRMVSTGRALGYGRATIWVRLVLPMIWPLIRLPVWVVLSYSLSNVDMAIILGPSNPPTLAVAVMRMFSNPDLAMVLPASAGAILQAGLVVAGVAALWLAEIALRHTGRWWLRRGTRGGMAEAGLGAAAVLATMLLGIGAFAMVSLILWSLAWRWPFPLILPESWALKSWALASAGWQRALLNTLILAAGSVAVSLVLAVLWLEAEGRGRCIRAGWAGALIYLPLLIPQIGFLYGLNVQFLHAGLPGGMVAVIWAQALFVFPYVMIALRDPWRALDPRLLHTAAALGAGPWRRLFRVRLPILLRPILTAAAIGVAVSVAQYLPTLFMGAGRIPTLTTEAVTLSSGSDRRVTGVYASLQAGLPFAAYLLAFLLPAWLHRNRRDLTGAPHP